jgi:hypothetical protein
VARHLLQTIGFEEGRRLNFYKTASVVGAQYVAPHLGKLDLSKFLVGGLRRQHDRNFSVPVSHTSGFQQTPHSAAQESE